MAEIPLTQGRVAIVDDVDFDWLSDTGPWSAQRGVAGVWYAIQGRGSALHRTILGAPRGVRVDHVNGDGLDNRRANLRLAGNTGNARNRAKSTTRPTSSRFKGVTWEARRLRWMAYITVNNRFVWLGRFTDEVEAARAYDSAAQERFGEFARLNGV